MSSLGYGYALPAANMFQSDVGLRLKRIRENQVIYNGLRDDEVIGLFMRNVKERPADCYYQRDGKAIVADGEYAKEMGKVYNAEIVYVFTDPNKRCYGGSANMLFGMDATLVSVFSVLNGFLAPSLAALMRNIRPLGLTELTGAETQAKGMTIIAGGVTHAVNYTEEAFVPGDLLCAIPLTVENAHKRRGMEGEAANSNGRITSILQPARRLNYYDPVDFRQAIWEELGISYDAGSAMVHFVRPTSQPVKGGGKRDMFDPDDPNDIKRLKRVLTRTHADEAFARSVVKLIEFHAQGLAHESLMPAILSGNFVAGQAPDLDEVARAFSASALLFLAQTFYHPGTAVVNNKAIDEFCGKMAVATGSDPAPAGELARRIKDLLRSPLADAFFKKNVVHAAIAALMEMILAFGQSIMGVAITPSMPLGHSQMHLCRY